MKKRILVVEDDTAILRGLTDNLRFEGYDVIPTRGGDEGLRIILEEEPDLVILDIMLPALSGYDVCRRARKEGKMMPILMLTARAQEVDRVMGLDLGADDYVTKPFSIPELMARIRALLRRAEGPSLLPDHVTFGDVRVEFGKYEAIKGGETVRLAPKEFGVLRLLVAREGKVVTRTDLLHEVWGYDHFPTTRTVDNHMASLRAKLEDDAARPAHLLTVHGVGYKFVGNAGKRSPDS
ncbi:MAG: response regulator transcription factor [Gemmatimonadetes bacterium]|nr:response regulator transcription factor [Gemmatimonadota bacterium]NNM04565.1 response regulator transcription factor [Gemmatimonadota bacterium]